MKSVRSAVLLVLVALAAGCSTKIRVQGPGDADVHAILTPGGKEFTFVGRKADDAFIYSVPKDLENQKVTLLVKTNEGAWKYTVFTDRDVVVYYPPKGPAGVGIGAIEAVLPDAPKPAPKKPPAPKPAEEPSATLSD